MTDNQNQPPLYASLTAVLLVDDLVEVEANFGYVEFHADCLAQGLFGDLFKIGIYHCENDLDKIAELRRLLRPGSLVQVRDEAIDSCGEPFRLMGPKLLPYDGDTVAATVAFAKCLVPEKADQSIPTEAPVCIRGHIADCRVLETKNAGPMAVAKVETMGSTIEAVFFPEDFQRFKELLLVPDDLLLYGYLDEGDEGQGKKILVNDVRLATDGQR